jgi:hypothetical protein
VSLIDTLRQDFENLIGGHAEELERAGQVAEAAAGDPLVQTALAAGGLTTAARQILAEAIAKLDAEFGRLAAEHAAAVEAARQEAAVAVPGAGEGEVPPAPDVPADPAAEPHVETAEPGETPAA